MGDRDEDPPGKPHREQTDESLRVERAKVDGTVAKQLDNIEDDADLAVQEARDEADNSVKAARDEADLHGRSRSPDQQERERGQADEELAKERSTADSALDRERRRRDRYLADFLSVERQATDQDLTGERASADDELAARDDFLGMVSHDLRGMLGGLQLNAELLSRRAPKGDLGDAMRQHAATSQRLIARMSRMVNDLVDLTSIEAGQLAITSKEIEVAQIVRDTIEAFGPIAKARGVDLTASDTAEAVAWLDADRIQQVLANLVSNALKFTPAGGEVSIRAEIEGGELHFAVRDTGVGIPVDALGTIFEKYRQVSHDRRGIGLGLYISRSIVEAHGGRMWVESERGSGSTFHCALPMRFTEQSAKEPAS